MPQLSLYLDDDTMALLRERSQKAGLSLSKCASSLINEGREGVGWPDGYWSIYGALLDDTFEVPPELGAAHDGALPAF